ncbi:D-beta-hydroxybutyrate dehydrogenase, mitochondrial-like [Argiope bruennichi]|uniref:D-beta-hydroxybutyrate dehydrogenase, mitochondrial-like n=1 Tax=Argiope bruennichi TaxID=94029 RepID=UPI00249587C3|nr:D-beta-hydroxybutyrate dehydrogenase, mitochondrial-like [Argiope bruennichi]
MLPSNCQIASLAKKKLLIFVTLFILLLSECSNNFIQKNFLKILVLLCVIYLIKIFLKRSFLGSMVISNNKAVLITGCDTGFGFHTAKRLSEKGFQVFAGCLSPLQNGGQNLSTYPNIHCLKMDVSLEQDIESVLNYVKENLEDKELWAIINNAGISKGSEIEMTTIQKMEEVIDVNLLGTIRVTKAFLPLLRKSKGRAINVASAAGRLTLPGFVTYSASKQAIIAFSDGLRLEMQKFGVSVITIEPWMFRTRLSDPTGVSRHIEKQWTEAEDDIRTAYTAAYATQIQKSTKGLFAWVMDSNICKVIDAMEAAVTSECPPYHYRPGRWYLNTFLTATNFFPKSWIDYLMCQYVFKNH